MDRSTLDDKTAFELLRKAKVVDVGALDDCTLQYLAVFDDFVFRARKTNISTGVYGWVIQNDNYSFLIDFRKDNVYSDSGDVAHAAFEMCKFNFDAYKGKKNDVDPVARAKELLGG